MSKAGKEKSEEPEKPEADAAAGGEGEGEGSPKKGKKKLLIIVVVVVLLGAGAGLYFSGMLGGGKDKPKKEGEAAESSEDGKKPGDAAAINSPVYYELPQFLVNLNSQTGHVSFLKMSVTLELKDKASVAVMDANKPRIVDTFNTYLRELRPADLQGSAGIYHLRNELMARLNGTIEDGIVKDILFGEIIVQ